MGTKPYQIINVCAAIVMILRIQFLFNKKEAKEIPMIQPAEVQSVSGESQISIANLTSDDSAVETQELSKEDIDDLVKDLSEQERDDVLAVVEDGFYEVDVLKEIYDSTQSDEVLTLIIQEYLKDLDYDSARNYLDENEQLVSKYISRNDYIFIYANTSNIDIKDPESINQLKRMADLLFENQKITQSTYFLYEGLVHLWNNDIDQMYSSFNKVTDPLQKGFLQAIAQDTQFVNAQKHVPDYYLRGLFALTVMQYKYINIAQKIALDILFEDDSYILPYQILSYSHFVRQERKKAASYTRDLLARDSQQRPMYQFLLGVIAFRQEKHQEAILYFIGVDEQDLLSDVYRYMILSYAALQDYDSVVANIEKLMGEDMSASDYYTVFMMTYFEPMRYNKSYDLLSANPNLTPRLIQQCYKKFTQNNKAICDVGYVGKLIYEERSEEAQNMLLGLAKNYPQGFVFEALGDLYLRQGDKEKAVSYYLHAMRLMNDVQERFETKNKILEIREALN